MNILLLASHAIAEYDDIRMFTDLGYDVFCPGGYQDPTNPGEGLRPGIPNAKVHPDLIEACERVRRGRGDPGHYIDWAKAAIPDEVLDWADVVIAHHFLDRWVVPQWARLRHKRVIWRTCGQSNPELESLMGVLPGLEIVRYSPKERQMPNFAGETALIRFAKYPADYGPWTGTGEWVGNVTQHMKQRGDACGYAFWRDATAGLPVRPAGPGSEEIGGVGALSYDSMKQYLAECRVYLYTGTVPAPYTLGLMEAMLTGTPVLSITRDDWGIPWLFEGDAIAGVSVTAEAANEVLRRQLTLTPEDLRDRSDETRQRAIDLFDVAHIGPQWVELLGPPSKLQAILAKKTSVHIR